MRHKRMTHEKFQRQRGSHEKLPLSIALFNEKSCFHLNARRGFVHFVNPIQDFEKESSSHSIIQSLEFIFLERLGNLIMGEI